MSRYNPKEIESKWQKLWDEQQTYKADLASNKPKYFAMSMLNYPSGSGIHIGHAANYTISDVMARFARQKGYESYHPVGWDSFGLPAENYAIKSGISPQKSIAEIIPNYHKQYKAMGWSNDWSKEISTHEPEYYKWTQWIFAQAYRAGLVYQDSRMQWWCSIDNTVLADEQVTAEGKCWRHDNDDDPLVEKREIKQWFFKITDYAEELLSAIDELDWTNSVKQAQKNWIGKSVGALIDFKVAGSSNHTIKIFTSRPDTLFGATFIVLAPEHPLVKVLNVGPHQKKVEDYVTQAAKMSEVERQENKEKTGVDLGVAVVNPASGEKVPVWVADYVLMSYGTGAIMAVPAHDERDHEFATEYNLPIVKVIESPKEPYAGEGKLINSGKYDGMDSAEAREKLTKEFGKEHTNYRMRDWSVSRQRYWGAPVPVIHCSKCGPQLVPDKDLPVVLPEMKEFEPAGDGRGALARAAEWVKVACPNCSGNAQRDTDTIDTYVDSAWYFLRYLDPANKEKIFNSDVANKWMPVDFYNGGDHATAHMLYARFITRFFAKQGLLTDPEPFKKFLFNGKVVDQKGKLFSKSKGNAPDPLEIVDQGYGADALRTYLMFAAPLDQWVRWDPKGVPGTYRFLNRLWNICQEFSEAKPGDKKYDVRFVHRTIKKATHDIETQRYNTAIAAMMAGVNGLYKLKDESGISQSPDWRFAVESLVQLVAPFAPFMASELWQQLGHKDSVHIGHWPEWDEALVTEDEVTLAVQINGKVRAEISVAADASETEVVKTAKDAVADKIAGQEIKKEIYVPGRIVNLVL